MTLLLGALLLPPIFEHSNTLSLQHKLDVLGVFVQQVVLKPWAAWRVHFDTTMTTMTFKICLTRNLTIYTCTVVPAGLQRYVAPTGKLGWAVRRATFLICALTFNCSAPKFAPRS